MKNGKGIEPRNQVLPSLTGGGGAGAEARNTPDVPPDETHLRSEVVSDCTLKDMRFRKHARAAASSRARVVHRVPPIETVEVAHVETRAAALREVCRQRSVSARLLKGKAAPTLDGQVAHCAGDPCALSTITRRT